jgi:hypothetical protein
VTVVPEDDDNVSAEIEAAITAEIDELKAKGRLVRIEPRCKVCREKPIRKVVNELLNQGVDRPAIVRILETLNAERDPKDHINYFNVRNHQLRHYNASNPAAMVWESIRRRYVNDTELDLEDGIGAEINAMSYMHIMMVKGLQNLVDEDTEVPYGDGAKAAIKLHELLLQAEESGAQQAAQVIAKMNRVIAAVQEFIPEDQAAAFMARLDGTTPAAIEGTVEGAEVEEFDPDIADDDDDEDL